jgi:gas vesicle protein
MSDSGNSGDFVAGLVIGGLIGAATALLLAPRPGDETLAQLREKGIELKDRAADLSAEAVKRVTDLEDKGRSALEEQKSRIQGAVEEGKVAAQRKRDEMLDALAEEQEAGEAAV